MKSILCCIIKPEYTLFKGIDLEYLSANPNPKIAKLIMKYPNYALISSNPNPGLTKFILNNTNKIIPTNTNPKLAYLIMERPNWYGISGNSNIGLTEFILSNLSKIKYDWLSKNTNPLLAELIIKNKHRLDWYEIFKNSNSGLTNFIMEQYSKIYLYCLCINSNPDLTDFIIGESKPDDIDIRNTNKKLIKYRLSYLIASIYLAENSHVVILKKIELM